MLSWESLSIKLIPHFTDFSHLWCFQGPISLNSYFLVYTLSRSSKSHSGCSVPQDRLRIVQTMLKKSSNTPMIWSMGRIITKRLQSACQLYPPHGYANKIMYYRGAQPHYKTPMLLVYMCLSATPVRNHNLKSAISSSSVDVEYVRLGAAAWSVVNSAAVRTKQSSQHR